MDMHATFHDWARPDTQSPFRLLRSSVLWLALPIALAALLPLVYGFAIGFHNARTAIRWTLDPATSALLAGIGVNLGLALASLRRGYAVGQGSLSEGLALGPIERPGLLILFVLGCMAVPGFMGLLLHALINEPLGFVLQDRLHQFYGSRPPATLGTVILIVVLAPLTEELFFRGWLWTGLSHTWSPRKVFLATAIPFLLLHIPGGLYRPLTLLPATMFISLARHCCGGIRASILVHAMNNLAAMALVFYIHSL